MNVISGACDEKNRTADGGAITQGIKGGSENTPCGLIIIYSVGVFFE